MMPPLRRTERLLLPFAILIAVLYGSGCLVSLQPLYNDKDLVFESKLLGVWKDPESSVTWDCRRAGEKSYQVVFTDEKGQKATFAAHLLEVEGERFIDLFPVTSDLRVNTLLLDHLVPVHTFAHVLGVEPELRFAILDDDWLKKRLTVDPKVLRHERRDDDIVITASAEELQRFLLANLASKGAFRPTGALRRSR
jgi:hypothetical protein